MAIVEQLIRSENDSALSFGNYELSTKAKVEDFLFGGSSYKVKTFCEITRLEKDGVFAYESVPGTGVNGFVESENGVEFSISGKEDAQSDIKHKSKHINRMLEIKPVVLVQDTEHGSPETAGMRSCEAHKD